MFVGRNTTKYTTILYDSPILWDSPLRWDGITLIPQVWQGRSEPIANDVNGVINTTNVSQILTNNRVTKFIATNTGINPIYIRFNESGDAVIGEGIVLLYPLSNVVIEFSTQYPISVISDGDSTLAYYLKYLAGITGRETINTTFIAR